MYKNILKNTLMSLCVLSLISIPTSFAQDSSQGKEKNQQKQEKSQQKIKTYQGSVLGYRTIESAIGSPDLVVLGVRTPDKQVRQIPLGDESFVIKKVPKYKKGEQIKIDGRIIKIDGKKVFKAERIRSKQGEVHLPRYRFNKTLTGELVGLKNVRMKNGKANCVLAKVRTKNGKNMNVVLGSDKEVHQQRDRIKTNAPVEIIGYHRITPQGVSFVVQDVEVVNKQDQQKAEKQQKKQKQNK